MDMSVTEGGSIWSRLTSPKGFTAVSHIFIMEWAAVLRDIMIGLLVAGAVAAWVPGEFWSAFFLVDHPGLARLWGPIVGPVVAVLSFVCSVGNVPLAAVLWNGGINTTFLNIAALLLAGVLIIRFIRSGGRGMLKMMGGNPDGTGHQNGGDHADDNEGGRDGDVAR